MATYGFTPASGQDIFMVETAKQSSSTSGSVLSGKEAREFYENLMKGEKGHGASKSARTDKKDHSREHPNNRRNRESNRRLRRRLRAAEMEQTQVNSVAQRSMNGEGEGNQRGETSVSERLTELLGLRLLRCAHEGDISGLKDLLSKGVDINFQDTYFWTAMMCASWSGQTAAVRLLLQHGAAWVGVVDTQGRDAKDLALEAGHSDLLEELENYGRSPQKEAQSHNSTAQAQWCSVCGAEFHSSLSSHLSSTLHQFTLRRPAPTPYYCLPPSSNSYKMMVRCGWKPGAGLGPEGEGPRQPVSTVLKRDHKGLGFGPAKKAKVTHFQARDGDAVKALWKDVERAGRGERNNERRRKEQTDKNWERDFRTSFYL